MALTALAILAVIVVAALGLRLYLGRGAEDRLGPGEIVDFAARGSSGRDNVFAMCPVNYCTPAADTETPVFEMRWERLRDDWGEVIGAQNRVELVAADPSRRRYTYIQRSLVLRFPDIVTVEFVPLGEDRSSLAIDSRSRYGRSDFGVNRRRVTSWVELLKMTVRDGRRRAVR